MALWFGQTQLYCARRRPPSSLLPCGEDVPAHWVRLAVASLNRPHACVVAYLMVFCFFVFVFFVVVLFFCGRILCKQIFPELKGCKNSVCSLTGELSPQTVSSLSHDNGTGCWDSGKTLSATYCPCRLRKTFTNCYQPNRNTAFQPIRDRSGWFAPITFQALEGEGPDARVMFGELSTANNSDVTLGYSIQQ